MTEVNKEIKDLLRREGKTQRWLAETLGVSHQCVNNQFITPMSLKTMRKYANILGYECRVEFVKIGEKEDINELLDELASLEQRIRECVK